MRSKSAAEIKKEPVFTEYFVSLSLINFFLQVNFSSDECFEGVRPAKELKQVIPPKKEKH